MMKETAVEKIHQLEKFGSILGLERMTSLMELLGNPERDLKVIHVAGTNGKGSVCRYIYSVLQEAGYRCGLYTSPFLEVFSERIEFNGEYISDGDLEKYTDIVMEKVSEMTSGGQDSPTEFEVITAVAFLYFKEKGTDFVVLEVGLGGTGDSTNVVENPLVSVIASISYDHMDRLGNTLTEIAGEKAGIIKKGCPVVTSAGVEEALQVLRKKSEELGCEYRETYETPYTLKDKSLGGTVFNVKILDTNYEDMKISMLGEHQVKNAICALTAIEVLKDKKDIEVEKSAIYSGMAKAKQIGRLEVMSSQVERPLVLIDGAHNSAGAAALKRAVKELCPTGHILMVTGMLADKDTDSIVGEFMEITHEFIATEPDNPRKMDAEALKRKIESFGGRAHVAENIAGAVALAEERKNNYDVILYGGSLYLIGQVRSLLRLHRGEK